MGPKMLCSFASILAVFLAVHQPFTVHPRSLRSTAPSLTSFQGLEESLKGQNKQGVTEVKRHLKALGYLDYEDENRVVVLDDDEFDETLESALRSYQRFYRLKVTGKLDVDTVKQMSVPRCGVPDFVPPRHANRNATEPNKFHVVSRYRFAAGMAKWPPSKFHLTYAFGSIPKAMSLGELRGVFWRAFQTWAHVTAFTFNEVSTGESPDFVIGFYSGDHGDGQPFDGPGGFLAHSSEPTPGFPAYGKSHYDADEPWSLNPSSTQMDLESVALHEIGHILGLAHSEDPKAVMYYGIAAGAVKRVLQQDDIDGIHTLYS
ncbi:metalloendoproteinase 1-like [Rhodamnia argentea]|uniref:Metalloendoproteinase 1-like n=1 Tax=Rhodamnia argentea TaxID=178133 RepID=A0A8B8R2A1_9MYRT|nr:metalloendoproteinase 1-like [Rhodamnia argentea]